MNKNEKKAVAYSVLAHIRNNGKLIEGPLDYFVPLVKRALNSMCLKGTRQGLSTIDINTEIFNLFSLDMPISVLNKILKKIEIESNEGGVENFKLFNDNSYRIKNYFFSDYEEDFQQKSKEIIKLEGLFKQYCQINNLEDYKEYSIVSFIEKNKINLSKYLSDDKIESRNHFSAEARFVSHFKNLPEVFDLIKNIYLGSIITSYLEYQVTEKPKDNIELLLDTNFIISLIDLNTPESTKTCNKLVEIAFSRGYKFTILKDTIDEVKALLYKKAENHANSTMIRYINPEDILNACERKKLNPNDLERIADNIEKELAKYQFYTIPYTETLKNKARNSIEYQQLKEVRNSPISALHDATAITYIKDKRGKKIKKFEEANSWFVNNSINNEDNNDSIYNNEFLKETIRADELLNILWLSNPNLKSELNDNEFLEIGLNSMISISLNNSLPKVSIIKELEENIHKYSNSEITEKDILNLSTRIVNQQIKNIQQINELATDDTRDEFVKKIKEESNKQEKIEEEKNRKLSSLFYKLENKINSYDEEIESSKLISNSLSYENSELGIANKQLSKENEDLLLQNRKLKIAIAIKKWRNNSIYLLIISLGLLAIFLILLGFFSNWNFEKFIEILKKFKENIILSSLVTFLWSVFTVFVLVNIYNRFYNESNIKAFKDNLDLK